MQPRIDQPQQTSVWLSGDSSCFGQREGKGADCSFMDFAKNFTRCCRGNTRSLEKGKAAPN